MQHIDTVIFNNFFCPNSTRSAYPILFVPCSTILEKSASFWKEKAMKGPSCWSVATKHHLVYPQI